MTRTSKILLAVLVVSVLIIGVGYAAIQNVTLNIDGEATGNPSDANFKVKFTGTPTTEKTVSVASSTAKVTATIRDDTHAAIEVTGLTAKGDTVTATYTVQNASDDLSADLIANSIIDNDEYFSVETRLGKKSLIAGEATTLVVTVELMKTPITRSEEVTISLQLTSVPVQPGEEGTSEGSTGGGARLYNLLFLNDEEYVALGDTLDLKVKPNDGVSNPSLTWTAEDTTVLSIGVDQTDNTKAKITRLKDGETVVTVASTEDESIKASITIYPLYSASQIFDIDGTNAERLHIGDFVNYDAGTWTQREIDAIKTGATSSLVTANGSTNKPSTAYQFGGFTANSSRNGNATPFTYTNGGITYGTYVKDATTNEAITGWRVFDVEGDTVTLISAGNPEDYYHPNATNSAYISEYILTGNVNGGWSSGETESQNYQKRDWGNYVNKEQKAENAAVLTKSKIDSWYTKYTNTSNANTTNSSTFLKIYQEPYTKYQNMIENYSYYWASDAHYSSNVFRVVPRNRTMGSNSGNAAGVRVLVSLTSDVKFEAKASGTKTVTGGNTTSYGGDQTYNVWDIR